MMNIRREVWGSARNCCPDELRTRLWEEFLLLPPWQKGLGFKPTLVQDWGHCMCNHSVLVTLVTKRTNNFGSFTLKAQFPLPPRGGDGGGRAERQSPGCLHSPRH